MERWNGSSTERRLELPMTPPVLISIHPDKGGTPTLRAPDAVLEVMGGEHVTGTVEVKVLEDIEFGAFRIGFLWHTEGRGNRTTGGGGAETLVGEGGWRAGDRITFPFSLKAPWGPISYSGRILQVVWVLEARVCRSMLRPDVYEDIPVHLAPNPGSSSCNLGPRVQKASEMEAVKRGLGGFWFTLGLVLLLGSLVIGVVRNWDFLEWQRWSLFLAMAGGLALSMKGMWRRLGRGKLGEPTVQLSTSELGRGEEILFSVVLRPDQKTELRSLDVVLECEERVVQGHGQYRSHRRKTVFEKRLTLAKDLTIESHRGLRKKGTITIPDDAPTTFGAPDNQVVWWLHFRGDIIGWPDWKEPHLLTVKP
jgi:hypothetical protein